MVFDWGIVRDSPSEMAPGSGDYPHLPPPPPVFIEIGGKLIGNMVDENLPVALLEIGGWLYI